MKNCLYYVLIAGLWLMILFVPWGIFKRKMQGSENQNEMILSKEEFEEISSIMQSQKNVIEKAIRALNLKVDDIEEISHRYMNELKSDLSEIQIAMHNPSLREINTSSNYFKGAVKNPEEYTTRFQENTQRDIRQGKMCLDSLEQGYGGVVGLYECHGQKGNQEWFSNTNHTLEQFDLCLTSSSKPGDIIRRVKCVPGDPLQKWIFTGQLIRLYGSKYCLDSSHERGIITKSCSVNNEKQLFKMIKV